MRFVFINIFPAAASRPVLTLCIRHSTSVDIFFRVTKMSDSPSALATGACLEKYLFTFPDEVRRLLLQPSREAANQQCGASRSFDLQFFRDEPGRRTSRA